MQVVARWSSLCGGVRIRLRVEVIFWWIDLRVRGKSSERICNVE